MLFEWVLAWVVFGLGGSLVDGLGVRLGENVAVVDVGLEIPLVLGAEGAVGAAEGGSLSALVEDVSLEDVRVLVGLSAS